MAKLNVSSVTINKFSWSISGLSSPFNSTNYGSAGISTSSFTNGTTSRPNVLTYTTAWTNTTSTNTITYNHSLSAGYHTLYGFTSSGGKYWSTGSVQIYVPSSDSTSPTITSAISTNLPSDGFTNISTFNVSFFARDNSGGVGLGEARLIFNGNTYTKRLDTSGSTNLNISFESISCPSYCQNYTIKVEVYDKNWNGTSKTDTIYIGYDTTKPVLGNCDASYDSASNRISARGYATDNLAIRSVIYQISKAGVKVYGNVEDVSRVEVSQGTLYNFSKDADNKGFVLGSTYWIKFTAIDKANNYSTIKEVEVSPSLSRPSYWSWSSEERYAMENKGDISVMTWQRWNAFIDNVKGVASWYHNTPNDIYDIESSKMASDSKVLTAFRFNVVKNAIGSMNATGIADKVAGDYVLGSYFITLSLKLSQVVKPTTFIGSIEDIYNIETLHIEGIIEDGIRCKSVVRSNF